MPMMTYASSSTKRERERQRKRRMEGGKEKTRKEERKGDIFEKEK